MIEGPTRATLRDFQLQAGAAQALVVEVPDKPGGRIFADQLNTNGPQEQSQGRTAALRVRRSSTRRCCCGHCRAAATAEPGSVRRGTERTTRMPRHSNRWLC